MVLNLCGMNGSGDMGLNRFLGRMGILFRFLKSFHRNLGWAGQRWCCSLRRRPVLSSAWLEGSKCSARVVDQEGWEGQDVWKCRKIWFQVWQDMGKDVDDGEKRKNEGLDERNPGSGEEFLWYE